jgi:hypothetical protein
MDLERLFLGEIDKKVEKRLVHRHRTLQGRLENWLDKRNARTYRLELKNIQGRYREEEEELKMRAVTEAEQLGLVVRKSLDIIEWENRRMPIEEEAREIRRIVREGMDNTLGRAVEGTTYLAVRGSLEGFGLFGLIGNILGSCLGELYTRNRKSD